MAVLTEEQALLRDSVEAWVDDKAPISALRAVRDGGVAAGYVGDLYSEMADMGWTGIIVPEAYGGLEFGYLSLGLVIERLGRNLAASPLISSAVGGASALELAGSEQQKSTWLEKIAMGEIVATLAIDESAHHDPAGCALQARPYGDGWQLNGVKRPVLHGMAAGLAIVSARTAGQPGGRDGITLFVVETQAEGLARNALVEIDARGAAVFEFADVVVGADDVLGTVDEGFDVLEGVLDRVRALMAAEMLGAASKAFDITVDYLKTREQFGQIIGSFQALQHRASAILGELEMTRSAVEAALIAIDQNDPDLSLLASAAKAMAGDTLKLAASEMIQMHGGIGMTDEHDAGLYYKHAFAADQTYGSAAFNRDRFGDLAGF